jgi:hypothetical protein
MSNRFRTSVALFAALAAAGAALAFPAQVELHNNHFRMAVEPETSAEVQPYSHALVTVRDADQLKRMVCNIEQLNGLNGFAEDVGLTVVVLDLPAAAETTATEPVASLVAAPDGGAPGPESPPGSDAPPAAPPPAAPAAPKSKRAA